MGEGWWLVVAQDCCFWKYFCLNDLSKYCCARLLFLKTCYLNILLNIIYLNIGAQYCFFWKYFILIFNKTIMFEFWGTKLLFLKIFYFIIQTNIFHLNIGVQDCCLWKYSFTTQQICDKFSKIISKDILKQPVKYCSRNQLAAHGAHCKMQMQKSCC